MPRRQNLRAAERGIQLSIFAYICLSAIKIYVSSVALSAALMADGFNNATDIIAALALLVGLKVAQLPARATFPYGFLRAETFASLIASLIMLTVGLRIFAEAFSSLRAGPSAPPSLLAAYASLFCMVVMLGMYIYNTRLAKKLRSVALYTAALDNRSDALVSLGVAVGIICAVNGLVLLDLLTALIVGALIVKTAVTLFFNALSTLMDAFQPSIEQQLTQLISSVDGVLHVRRLQGRTLGSTHFVNAEIAVHPRLSVKEGERVAADIARKAGEHFVLFIAVKGASLHELKQAKAPNTS